MAMGTVPSDLADDPPEAAREHRALAWTAAASLAVIFWLVRPIGLGILIGTLLAFLAQPACERLTIRIGARWAALTTAIASGFAVAATLGGLGWLFVSRGTVLATRLVAAVGPLGLVDSVVTRVGAFTARFGVSSDQLRDHVRDLASDAANSAERIAAAIASTTASALLGLLFTMLAMHYILRNGERVSRRIADVVPLRPAYTLALVAEFRRVGRATLLGSVITGIVQGGLATIGFWVAGVPEPLFFGAATALASFVPVVGVLLVIVPTSIGLAVTGHMGSAIIALGWGLVVVIGVSDYVIRPRLIRGEAKVPSIVTLAALLGGVEVLGLQGLLVGPMLMTLAFAVLQLYAAEMRARRHLEPEGAIWLAPLPLEGNEREVVCGPTRAQSGRVTRTEHERIERSTGQTEGHQLREAHSDHGREHLNQRARQQRAVDRHRANRRHAHRGVTGSTQQRQ